MSLSGTLDTLSLPELLTVLAATRRTGELVVRDSGFEGVVWLARGDLVQAEVPGAADLVEAVTALLALPAGTFAFEPGPAPSQSSEPTPLAKVLDEAQARRSEWLALEAAVPSLTARFRLAPGPAPATVSLQGDHWRVLAGLAGGRTVKEAMDELSLPELEARRAVRALLDFGLLEPAKPPIGEPEPLAPPVVEPEQAGPEVIDLEAPPVPSPSRASSGDPARLGPPGDDELVSRDLLLRYLSRERS